MPSALEYINTVFWLGELNIFLSHSQNIPLCDAVVKIVYRLLM